METFLLLAILILAFFTLWKLKWPRRNGRKMPIPGPSAIESLRIVASAIRDKNLHVHLSTLANSYGDIMQFNLLFKRCVITNDIRIFRRLVSEAEYRAFTNDRPPSFASRQYFYGKDILFTPADASYLSKRKIFQTVLKPYVKGIGPFEQVQVTFLQEMVESMNEMKIIDLSASFKSFIAKSLSYVFVGDTSEMSDVKIDSVSEFGESIYNMLVFEVELSFQIFPFVVYLPLFKSKQLHRQALSAKRNMHTAFLYQMKRSIDARNRNGLIHALLAIQKDLGESRAAFQLDDETIEAMVQSVVVGGYISTCNILSSLFLFLIKYQNIQTKIYEEIKSIIGKTTPSFQHKQKMPFTEAAVLETYRLSSITPLLIPHLMNNDVTLDGYLIPKSTIIIMNAWHQHHRTDYWDDPCTFKPDRFLDANGQLLSVDHPVRQRVMAFGTGLRACPGESFATARVFLATVYLLKDLMFLPDTSNPSPDPSHWKGDIFLSPGNIMCKIKMR